VNVKKMDIEYLAQSLRKLDEALREDGDTVSLVRDATILRFRICSHLFCKTLQKILAHENIESTSPRDILKKSFQEALIDDEKSWLTIMDLRMLCSHAYKEKLSKEVFKRIKKCYPIMQATYEKLAQRYDQATID
jgi:nucleotidyltransferase substrate binding protein (TIGR01987 family)